MIEKLLNQYKKMVESRIEELFPEVESGYSHLVKAARYSLLSGGKRIRPAVMMEFCKLCGGKAEDALDFAVALEMICERSVPQFFNTAKHLFGVATPIQTVPTGFSLLPPLGPAMPVVEMAKSAPEMTFAPFAIAIATCSETAPF